MYSNVFHHCCYLHQTQGPLQCAGIVLRHYVNLYSYIQLIDESEYLMFL